ncbi:MAG TPA: hypothetical protein VFY71_10350 [Planctomycetota bacterium]|nr:hypothetical protein [Planctomycetota bacterium]
MIARPDSHDLADRSSGVLAESALAPDARLRAMAHLLAVGALRALWPNVGRPVANVAAPAPGARAARSPIPLALGAEAEPSSCHARAPGAARPPLADDTTESKR